MRTDGTDLNFQLSPRTYLGGNFRKRQKESNRRNSDRLQYFAAVVAIHIPEVWRISSRTFLRVARARSTLPFRAQYRVLVQSDRAGCRC